MSDQTNPEGRLSAVLCAFYGIMPWDQDRLTRAQIENLMQELGYIKFLRDEVHLRWQFGKIIGVAEDEVVPTLRKMLQPPQDDPLSALRYQAWEAWAYPRYGMPLSDPAAQAEARTGPRLDISKEAALGILEDVEQGGLSDAAWANLYRGGTFRAVCAIAGEALAW